MDTFLKCNLLAILSHNATMCLSVRIPLVISHFSRRGLDLNLCQWYRRQWYSIILHRLHNHFPTHRIQNLNQFEMNHW